MRAEIATSRVAVCLQASSVITRRSPRLSLSGLRKPEGEDRTANGDRDVVDEAQFVDTV
jgi:hypothetical protein